MRVAYEKAGRRSVQRRSELFARPTGRECVGPGAEEGVVWEEGGLQG